MSNQQTLAWKSGTTAETLLPPIADPHNLTGPEQPFLQYYQLGPD
jgi:hypothetical protein